MYNSNCKIEIRRTFIHNCNRIKDENGHILRSAFLGLSL